MAQFWKALWSDNSGQGLTEYALFIGLVSVALTLIAIGIAGGVLALALALGRGQLFATLARTWQLALRLVTLGGKGANRNIESGGALT